MFTYTLSGKAIENGRNRITVDYTNGTVKCSETFFFSSKEDLDTRITNKIADLDKVVALDADLVTTGYVIVEKVAEPEPVVVPPTPEEIKQSQINVKEVELIQIVEQAKRDKEIALIAAEDNEVASKLAELEALKSKK